MDNLGPVVERQVLHVSGDGHEQQSVRMVAEEPLSLEINGSQVAVLMRLPGQEKELAAGFVVSEGIVRRFDDVLLIHHCGQGLPAPGDESVDMGEGAAGSSAASRNKVQVRVKPEAVNEDARLDVVRLIRAGCGAVDVDRSELLLEAVTSQMMVAVPVLRGLGQKMRSAQKLHKFVGGVHAAALFESTGELVVLCEDVGRHNAVDKAIGHCLLRGIPLEGTILLCSGRLSYEMVTKVIRVNIPVLASVSAPTALAVQLADTFNLTAIGYLRGQRMTVYTHAERVSLG